ncbi:MAG: diadenosine tetraphosphate (Ap4A) HIT family hydrolase [Gammaproteobacteria bacterium]|jgi:diadenosine tetraphosphate (Ap4A) HIT family hydrolase
MLHQKLREDCHYIAKLELCHLLLLNDCQFPWCILVPDRPDITEIYQLTKADQQQLLIESSALGEAMMNALGGDKLNIGAIGNMVPQLHIHHIVRKTDDACWPAPVWGAVSAKPYSNEDLKKIKKIITGFTSLPIQ